jgi:hypothetical protein
MTAPPPLEMVNGDGIDREQSFWRQTSDRLRPGLFGAATSVTAGYFGGAPVACDRQFTITIGRDASAGSAIGVRITKRPSGSTS